jgi:protein phosphatase
MPPPDSDSPPPHSAARLGDQGPRPARVTTEAAARTHQGMVRASNEDSYVVFRLVRYLERVLSNIPESDLPTRTEDTGYLMVVADGMGGHKAGEVASRSALISALQMILRSPRWALNLDDPATREMEISSLLARSRGYLSAVHTALRAQADQDASLTGMGTTLTGAYTVGADMFVLHVGDSKAFLMRADKLQKITHDHTVAQQYADLGVIPQEAVSSHHASHMLTRAIGAPTDELSGDMHHLRIENGDRLLLCSDGLTDMASEDQILSVLRSRSDCGEACQGLVDLALTGGGRDNITVIVANYRVE